MKYWLYAGAILVQFCALLSAQEFRATLSGTVMDSSGSAIPNAVVQAKNVETNEVTSATSDTQGLYRIPFLRPGNYTLTAEGSGFKKTIRAGIILQVSQAASVNLTLEIGAVSDSITVSADTPLLETEKADRGGVVNTQQVAELPLNARNPYILGSMMAGVTFRGSSIWQRPFDNGAIAEWSINGGWQSNNEFLLDGAPNNAQAGSNNVAYVPIVDAVQEFKVQTSSYDAQYGHSSGGIMNVILKSGTNDFHATGWEFMRRQWLDANTFQNNSRGAERANHYLDQYGFLLSGPIVVPKIYDGRNKTFFMGSFENYREGTPSPLLLSVPQPEFLNGDFSKLTNANNQPVQLYNPFSGHADPNAPGGWVRDPFPNNQIPANMINPIARNILGYAPQPNVTTPGSAYSQNNFSMPNYFATDKFYNLILKFDQNFGDKHRLFFRHASNDRTEDRNDNGVLSGPGQGGQQPFQRINDAYVFDWVAALSSSFVLNVRGSYNRFIEKGFGADNIGFDLTSLGFPASTVSQLPGGQFFGRYEFNGNDAPDYAYLGRYRDINISNNYALNVNVTKILGAHSLHAGIDMRRIHYILQNTGNIWYFNSKKDFTQQVWNRGDEFSGNAIASFLLGVPQEGSSNYPLFPFFRQWYFAPFLQDDWKITRKLTLNLGIRWDINMAPEEKYNRMNGAFDPNVRSPIADQLDTNAFPQLANLRGGLTFPGVNGRPTTNATTTWMNIQPRAGFAYQLTNRVILRGGFGIYYLNPNNDWSQNSITGFSTSTPLVTSLDGGRTPRPGSLTNPYPGGVLTPTGSADGPLTNVGRDFQWFNPNFVIPRQHQFSFGFQVQLPASSVLDVAYIGGRGYNFQMNAPYNIPSLDFRKKCNILEGGNPNWCNEQVPNPFKGLPAFAGTTLGESDTMSRFDLNRPFPQFSGNLQQNGLNGGRTWYNALQLNYNVRFKSGLNLLANYTWSRFTERWSYNDPYAQTYQQGPYFLDRPHVFKFTAVYELPFGRGKAFGSGANRLVDGLIGGWEVTTFLTRQSGEPADLPRISDNGNDKFNTMMLKDPKIKNVDFQQNQVQGWSPCVLRMDDSGNITPQQYSIDKGCGTDQSTYSWLILPSYAPNVNPMRSGQIRMSPTTTMDASLNKWVNITERLRIQLRAEAFNVLNHYAFPRARFITNPNDPNFGSFFPGQISTVDSGFPRQIQLGLKLYW